MTMDDVIIIGGSFAGLGGALQLGRARRKVTVLDTGLPRNRFAGHSHGLLGHDHKPPLDILAEARQQLARYPTIKLVSARAESVSGAIDDFNVLTSDGESFGARRLILSYGVADQMPDVPGFAEGWGTSIVPCPYCDGFEVAGRHWGLVWSGRQSHQSARLFHDWTDTLTLFADGHDIPADIRADLARRSIPIVDGRIIEIAHNGGHTATVTLDTRRNVAVDILFAHPRNKPSQPCMNHWASPRSIRPWASPSRSTSAAKPACPVSTPPATSPTHSCPRSPWHHRKVRWRVSSPSSRCWIESREPHLRAPIFTCQCGELEDHVRRDGSVMDEHS
jgi:thioredoxin reductase